MYILTYIPAFVLLFYSYLLKKRNILFLLKRSKLHHLRYDNKDYSDPILQTDQR